MSLRLLVGPPNSGRAGEVLRRLRASLDRNPALIVPTPDDAAQLERELSADGEPILGASVGTFGRLFEELSRAVALDLGPPLRGAERLALLGAAVDSVSLRALAR